MIVWVEQGWIPAGNWNLPAELQHPDKFALTSDRAQFILEQGGFAGYGAALDSIAIRPMGWRRYRAAQGRSSRPMGYRGTLSWDEYANRLSIP